MYKNIAFFLSAAILNYSIIGTGTEGTVLSFEDRVSDNTISMDSISNQDVISGINNDENSIGLSENMFWESESDCLREETSNEILEEKETISHNEEYKRENEEFDGNEYIGKVEEVSRKNICEDKNEENNFSEEIIDIVSENKSEQILEEEEKQERTIISENEVGQRIERTDITEVSMPANVKVCFDPQNLYGNGQIFSEKYQIENYGNSDIAIKIKNINILYNGDQEETYEFSEKPVERNVSKKKQININIVWENKSEDFKKVLNVVDGQRDEYVVYLKAAKYDKNGKFVRLNKESKGCFYFTGTLNSNPEISWEDGEISINYEYDIVNGETMENREEIIEFIENVQNEDIVIP